MLSKTNKRLINFGLFRIIMNYGGRTAFAMMEQHDRALCQLDAYDKVSLLVDSSKSWKIPKSVACLGK